MDQPARLFLCARCRIQVLVCSQCDRGNRYCSRTCWRLRRTVSLREAARRYQCSQRGRLAHAERSRRWRERQSLRGLHQHAASVHNVTHQGSPAEPADAPLLTCTTDTTETTASATEDTPAVACPMDSTPSGPASSPPAAQPVGWHCLRCANAQPPLVRQGFLRHHRHRHLPSGGPRTPPWPGLAVWRHDHSP